MFLYPRLHPVTGYQTCLIFWADLSFFYLSSPSSKTHVSTQVCCVWKDFQKQCVIIRSIVYDTQF